MNWTEEAQAAGLAKLREPFAEEAVGKLPATPKRPMELDYVGHAVVTDRLLSADPEWNWEPLALDERGLPAYDSLGGLWIKLTVCGVTRLGYGDGPDPKQRIGDALRNAGMRFGIALYLWGKDELESLIGNETVKSSRQRKPPRSSTSTAGRPISRDPATEGLEGMSARDRNRIISHLAHADPPLTDPPAVLAHVNALLGDAEPVMSLVKLTADQGRRLFEELGIEP